MILNTGTMHWRLLMALKIVNCRNYSLGLQGIQNRRRLDGAGVWLSDRLCVIIHLSLSTVNTLIIMISNKRL